MKLKKTKTDNYQDSYIAFLDILGFKNRVKRDGFKKIQKIYSIMRNMTGHDIADPYSNAQIALTIADDPDKPDPHFRNYNDILGQTNIRVMSDSIIVATPALYPEALAVNIDICNTIQYMLYEYSEDFTDPVLLRGAIARGDIYIYEDMMFGQGMIDAYLAQEKIAVYPRIIISERVIDEGMCKVSEYGGFGVNGFAVDRRDQYRYIDTMGNWLLDGNCGIQIHKGDKYKGVKSHIDHVLAEFIDSRIRDKYLWLREDLERAADVAEQARLRHEEFIKEQW